MNRLPKPLHLYTPLFPQVLRDGQVLEYDIVLSPLDSLVPVHKYDQLPSYFIYAGLVFVPLTQPYLHEYGDDWMANSPRRLVDKALNTLMEKPKQQIVILSQVMMCLIWGWGGGNVPYSEALAMFLVVMSVLVCSAYSLSPSMPGTTEKLQGFRSGAEARGSDSKHMRNRTRQCIALSGCYLGQGVMLMQSYFVVRALAVARLCWGVLCCASSECQ
jgi:hypothetical protein